MPRAIPANLSFIQPAIEKLCQKDNKFNELYQDYLQSVDALEYWRKNDSDEATVLCIEYQELTMELEQELLGRLLNIND